MKKVLDMLEANVQWLAIGLGVLYVLYMAYTYVVTPQVSVAIGGEQYSPGEIDVYTEDTVANDLSARMQNHRTPNFDVPQYVEAFEREIGYEGRQVPDAFAINWAPVGTVEKIEVRRWDEQGPRIDPGVERVAALPEPPPATMLEHRVGNSNVAARPADPNAPPAPPQPAPPGPGMAQGNVPEPAVPVEAGKDLSWVTVMYEISPVELASAFKAAKIPPELYQTLFVEVQLYRQERQPDGSWSEASLVPALPITPTMAMPASGAPPRDYENYSAWAREHAKDILQPAFFHILAGDRWLPPGEDAPATAQGPGDANFFDPAQYVDAPIDVLMRLTPEQRRAVAAYKQKLKNEQQRNRQPTAPSPGRRGPGGPGGSGDLPGFAPDDPDRPAVRRYTQEAFPQPRRPGNERPSDLPSPSPYPGAAGEQPYPYPQAMPEAQPAPVYPHPPGEFDPRNPPDPRIVGWAHDTTVRPGHVYRYRVIYKLRNPVWNRKDAVNEPQLAQQFAVASKEGEWSDEIEVPSLTSFFVLQTQSGKAKVAVFRWQGGQVHQKEFDVSPGDLIGASDGAIDFATGWTMVDTNKDLRTDDMYVILLDPDGRLKRRSARIDKTSPEYQRAQQQVASANGAGPGM